MLIKDLLNDRGKKAFETCGSGLRSLQMALQLKGYNAIFAVEYNIFIEHFHLAYLHRISFEFRHLQR